MNIDIFEDQTGYKLFPEKSYKKESGVVRLFDNKIDIFLEKGGDDKEDDNLEINCYALIHKGEERSIGCYIIGTDKYSDDIFTRFKNDANKALEKIGFRPKDDNVENAMFNNIQKFDVASFDSGRRDIDIDEISNALRLNNQLNYNTGDVSEIITFCGKLLKSNKKIKIAISTSKTNFGDVNILRNKTYEERLTPTVDTKEIFNKIKNDKRRKLEDENKKILDKNNAEKRKDGENKIDEGIKLIRDGLAIKADIGDDVYKYSERVYSVISGKPFPEKSKEIGKGATIIMTLAVLMLGSIIGAIIMQEYLFDKIYGDRNNGKSGDVTPTITPIITPGKTIAVVGDQTGTYTDNISTGNNISGETSNNTSNSTNGEANKDTDKSSNNDKSDTDPGLNLN